VAGDVAARQDVIAGAIKQPGAGLAQADPDQAQRPGARALSVQVGDVRSRVSPRLAVMHTTKKPALLPAFRHS
jgi:hypothetical protein